MIIENVQRKAAMFDIQVKHSSVSEMLDELGWPPLSQRRHEVRLIRFYDIINGLAEVPFEGIIGHKK